MLIIVALRNNNPGTIMSIGFDTIQRIRTVENQLATFGMRIGIPRYAGRDRISVFPLDDELPIYNRDAELFIGSLEEIECWLLGFQTARMYDSLLGVSDDKKRAKKEQSLKNKELLRMIETGKKL